MFWFDCLTAMEGLVGWMGGQAYGWGERWAVVDRHPDSKYPFSLRLFDGMALVAMEPDIQDENFCVSALNQWLFRGVVRI